jgi:selenide,water dikinase
VGLAGLDDAAVYRLNDETAIVQTVDFFPPVVDDPYTYGAIAAANAMSDVFAMGGEVVLALNVVAFPQDLSPDILSEILRGGAAKVAEAGGVIAGGHTIYDKEPKYGLCVMGVVHPDHIISTAGAKPGDALYLTKPLGTGIILTAAELDMADPVHVQAAIDSMLTLNRHPSHIARDIGVHAMTDVTGFGLLGHGVEMAEAGGVALQFEAGRLPILPGALAHADAGVGTGGGARNREGVGDAAVIDESIDEPMIQVLFDPQTSGGLLMAVPEEKAVELEKRMTADGCDCWRIGEVIEGSGVKVRP